MKQSFNSHSAKSSGKIKIDCGFKKNMIEELGVLDHICFNPPFPQPSDPSQRL